MPDFLTPLTFITDPGHGWLRVPLTDIAALGIEAEISSFSFIDGRYAYLEEDCDAGRYLDACAARGYPRPALHTRRVKRFNRCRPRFGDARFPPAFWDKLRR